MPFVWQESSKEILRQVNHDMFKESILPAVDRAMLRNPEIILQGLAGGKLPPQRYFARVWVGFCGLMWTN